MNTFFENLNNRTNYTRTENGALTHKSTKSYVYDMFAQAGAYRKRSDEDCILLFKNAYEENPTLAMKCLFYMRDCRGGQGERRFFRVCFKWLCNQKGDSAKKNLEHISAFGRWDDLIYATVDTALQLDAFEVIKNQLALDVQCKTPSLMAKWLPSENASAKETKRLGNELRQYLGWSHKQYRKTLSILRGRINVLERLMSAGEWDKIEFDKIPSKAGLVYKNAFARRDIIAKKYEAFAKSENTTVNASTLYPYDVVAKALHNYSQWGGYGRERETLTDVDRAMINKYWDNLPDYLDGAECNMLCVVDTSGSMCGSEAASPMNVALGLGMYCAERLNGAFKDHFVTFSQNPQFIRWEGVDFVDKVRRVYRRNECANTDLVKTFNLLLDIARKSDKKDIPSTIVVISDMQIDMGAGHWGRGYDVKTEMEQMRDKWAYYGLKMPKLVYWNVRAGQGNILDDGPDVSYVSGASPTIFKQVLTGKTGYDLMVEAICADRYACIEA